MEILPRKAKSYKLKTSRGVAALPVIVVISLIVLVIAVGISSSSYIENWGTYTEAENKKASFAAEAGAHDAYKRITKNTSCNTGGSPDCSSYTLSVADATATITVSGGSSKTILSIGKVSNVQVKIQVGVSVDADNKVTQTSWQQLNN